MSNQELLFRELKSFNEFQEVEAIQRDAWGMPDLEIVPKRLMYATVCSGGVAIGAFVGTKMVGYCWGWVGRKNKQSFIYSHHNAVRKAYQNKGIGYSLKIKQREWALKNDFQLITWTFDPLLSRNSYLNLHKLGAICKTYYVNHWGEMHDALNIGQQTDRFYVEWNLESKHVKDHLSKRFQDYSGILEKQEHNVIKVLMKDKKEHIEKVNTNLNEETIFVRIPSNFLELSHTDPDWANDWRYQTRKIFQLYFKRGYAVTDFILDKNSYELKCYHVLTKITS